jgi:putative hemolysin
MVLTQKCHNTVTRALNTYGHVNNTRTAEMNELPNPFASISQLAPKFNPAQYFSKFNKNNLGMPFQRQAQALMAFAKLRHMPASALKAPNILTSTPAPVLGLIAPQPIITNPTINSVTDDAAKLEIEVVWANHLDELREAQKLRYDIFAGEMGAQLNTKVAGHDVDLFDDFCEHLLIRNRLNGQVIGTYRLLTPAQAKRVGSTYSDTEFDLTRLRHLRDNMVELGRSCVHPEHRQGAVIMALWGALYQFMQRNGMQTMLGCASIPMLHNGVVSGDVAASVWKQVQVKHMAPIDVQVFPRLALPLEQLNSDLNIEPPSLIKGYLRLGAKVLGAPAWDPDFNTADLPMMMRLEDIPARYKKHFSSAAA